MKKYLLDLIGIIVGAAAGWLYWRFVGCASGTCPITSSPLMSALYGAILGYFVFTMFKTTKEKEKQEDEGDHS